MPNDYFEFKQFKVTQSRCFQKVSTDACIFGAWVAKNSRAGERILDIGAGTGLLMLMLAQQYDAEIDGIEIEETCAGQLQENIDASPWKNRLRAIHYDVRTYPFDHTYDLVVSNPPFYEKQLESPDNARNIAWHSHELTLTDLINKAVSVMSPQGEFSIMLPYSRLEEAIDIAAKKGLNASGILTVRHTREHSFSRCMIRFGFNQEEPVQEILDIRNEDGSYSEPFIRLLADYYLFL